MIKKLTFLLLSLMIITAVVANPQNKVFRNQTNNESTNVKTCFDRGGVVEATILTEDFSKFVAGDNIIPDQVRLDDDNGLISDEYFNTPGWKGSEVYQAGGCAYIGFNEKYQEPGLLITPLINTTGAIYINCRVRTVDPAGDIIGYNIMDKNMELLDANVDFFRATDEWTEISWFTSAGAENSYIYIFAYSKNIFIDDIEIVSLSLPAPTILEETNIGTKNFTANWEAVEDADAYIFKLSAQHIAKADETFYYTNTSFNNVVSKGTIEDPEILNEGETSIESWHIYMPALINEAIGITGKYASSEVFGSITSPVLDLSSNNGTVSLSFKAHADLNEEIIISLINSEYGYYDVADQKYFLVEKDGWNEYYVELSNGTDDTYIEITSFGFGNIFFDDLKLYQTIKEGDAKTLIIDMLEVNDTCYKANINDSFLNDVLSYQVASRKNVYSNNKIIGTIDSEYTETKNVTLNKETLSEQTVNIGEGELESFYAPISNYGSSNFSISQQIYTKDEINKESGSIKSISFHNKKGNTNTRKITVYMCNTVQDSYRDNKDWVLVDESQIVFNGDITFGTADEWTTIELQKPFAYNGQHIALTIYDASESNLGYSGNHDSFYATATDTLRGLYKTSDAKLNIYNLGEVYGYELKTSIYSTPANQYYINNIKFEIGASTIETPRVPQNLSANVIDETSIALSWTTVQNATSYNVYLGTEKLANVTTTYYLAEGLETNKEYCFSITALNEDIESEKSAEACASTFDIAHIEAPANLTLTPIDTASIALAWDSVATALSYNVYRNNEFIANVTTNAYADTGLNANTEYCYTVTSVDDNNNESVKSIEVCGRTMGCVGINELALSTNIYPNPVNDRIQIETELNVIEVSIYTITGVMVGQQTTDNGQQTLTINLSELNSGIYFIKINTDKGEIVKRIIKE